MKSRQLNFSYKDVESLRNFIDSFGKILPAQASKISSNTQKRVAREIKRARHLALLPFTQK
jgi:small subunit ribosomal protein S18